MIGLTKYTAWYWVEDGGPPIPMTITLDTKREILKWCEEQVRRIQISDDGAPHIRWIKAFRADNEAYEVFRWENPLPYIHPEPKKVYADLRKQKPWWRRWF